MNSRSLRCLAADHSALRTHPLPPNYLFPPTSPTSDDLSHLDILLAGPTHTPFHTGLFKLHLTIPPTYPQTPPTAHFRTPIFHPNVEPQTGGVCVETLKRDWDAKLTLRDVLVVINCLLIQPNPDSALNAEAGGLIRGDYAAFERRAELMTGIHAAVPRELREAVEEARGRGQSGEEEVGVEEKGEVRDFAGEAAVPGRRRRLGGAARPVRTVGRRSEGSPTGVPARRRLGRASQQPVVLQSRSDDVFGDDILRQSTTTIPEDGSIQDANSNGVELSAKPASHAPKATASRRPPISPRDFSREEEDEVDSSEAENMDLEYPPSPRKSPRKSPTETHHHHPDTLSHQHQQQPESSRDALRRARALNTTPPSNLIDQPLAEDSPFTTATASDYEPQTSSPRKTRTQQRAITPTTTSKPRTKPGVLFSTSPPSASGAVTKSRSPKTSSSSSSEKNVMKREGSQRRVEMDAKLWEACGRDIGRWNRGEFEGEPFGMKAGRW
ncbi:hypothetical protein LTR91_015052 [Friedmanniomyces endolithicus]|uniref:Ubiquitin-conjugating enzyme E2 2 n=1 Tax=Friedmanniomyces endolithicus TaxID=329885 RepID=A0A4U0UTW1_9PEZI|nr:hypothetical protein LTS09_010167 [Friedmanniomyces endolithicus]KAK0364120.1 hypothetical protein LTR94_012244 [Friedmanniomyces endolithicus]KAK0785046.1 hypothetical protein LTR59_011177 [Friedmanniomyces endolithicus]KAK0789183.1 hypothetical protein LTR38_011012 [Friedmanniomyces endolithicus]KAK0839248.1 hypothetical protein LTR03_011405 [Friedmanniomyces endolithicus]